MNADSFLLSINLETFTDLTTDADLYQLNRSLCCMTHDNYSTVRQNYALGFQDGVKFWHHFFMGKGVSDDPNTTVIHANNHSVFLATISTGYVTTASTGTAILDH